MDEPTRTDDGGAASKVNVNPIIVLVDVMGVRYRFFGRLVLNARSFVVVTRVDAYLCRDVVRYIRLS